MIISYILNYTHNALLGFTYSTLTAAHNLLMYQECVKTRGFTPIILKLTELNFVRLVSGRIIDIIFLCYSIEKI